MSSQRKTEFEELARKMFRPVNVPYEGIGIEDAVKVAWRLLRLFETRGK